MIVVTIHPVHPHPSGNRAQQWLGYLPSLSSNASRGCLKIGRENLITSGQMNELAHALWVLVPLQSFMADRMGLGSTMLDYLAVRQAMVSVSLK